MIHYKTFLVNEFKTSKLNNDKLEQTKIKIEIYD